MAADLNFSMRIGVEDGTEAGLQSAMSRFRKFFGGLAGKAFAMPFNIARGGLGILRDVNMGLMPLVRGIDQVIDRGSKLEVIRRGFLNLTGASSKNADLMARQIVRASSGTMRMAEGMALANRALGSMSFDDLLTAVEFISKKSVATGKDPGQALNTVITGLVRGSTLFLDDFGILVDGADGVARTFNAIKGSGAFEQLGPAAQKAETIRQALAEMRQQTDKLGISGKETFFLWSGIQNLIGDGVDKLVLAVAKSQALKDGLTGFANLLRGITTHFEKGGGFGELLFGGGKSGGILGVLGAGVVDLGEALGRGILGGLLKGLSLLPDIFSYAWDQLKSLFQWLVDVIPDALQTAFDWLKTEFLPAWGNTIKPLTDIIGQGIYDLSVKIGELATAIGEIHTKIVEALGQWFSGFMVGSDGKPTRLGTMFGVADPTDDPSFEIARARRAKEAEERLAKFESERNSSGVVGGTVAAVGFAWSTMIAGLKSAVEAIFSGEFAAGAKSAGGKAVESLRSRASNVSGTTQGLMANTLLSTVLAAGSGAGRTLWELFSDSAGSLLSGGVLGGNSRTKPAFQQFFDQFSEQPSTVRRKVRAASKPGELEFTEAKKEELRRRQRQIDDEKKAIERGDRGVRQEARRRAAAEEAQLKKDGYRITPSDRRRILARQLRAVQRERTEPLDQESDEIRRQLENNARIHADRIRQRKNLRDGANVVDVRQPDFNKMPDDAGAAIYAEEGVALIKQLVEIGNGLLAVLGGGDRQLAAVGGNRA